MKKEIPILFRTEMVQAILEGRKTMTRRIAKQIPVGDHFGIDIMDWGLSAVYKKDQDWYCKVQTDVDDSDIFKLKCPYGKSGDVLWVREEHYRFGHWMENGTTKKGKQKWRFVAVPGSDIFFAGDTLPEKSHKSRVKGKEDFNLLYKRLARFMPKSAARIWLEVTDIRVERLHDISESDIVSEGVRIPVNGKGTNRVLLQMGGKNKAIDFLPEGCLRPDAPKLTQQQLLFAHWAELWCDVNGPESWEANPWVWVVSFKVLSITGKPGQKVEACASSNVNPLDFLTNVHP